MILRYRGRLHHIGVGRPYAGWRVVMLVAGIDVQSSTSMAPWSDG